MFEWLTDEIYCEFKRQLKPEKLFNECNLISDCLQNNPNENDFKQLEISDESLFLVINLITSHWLKDPPTSNDELKSFQYLIDIVRKKVNTPDVQILFSTVGKNPIKIKNEIVIAMDKRMEKKVMNLIPNECINFITDIQSKRLQVHLKNETPEEVIETLVKLDDPDVELIVVGWKTYYAESTNRDNLRILFKNFSINTVQESITQFKNFGFYYELSILTLCENLHQFMKCNNWQFNINGERIKITVRPPYERYQSCDNCHRVHSELQKCGIKGVK